MLKKISIDKLFYLVIILTIFFEVFDIYFYFFIFVFIHELAHIFMAKKFGLTIEKMRITPIGQVAIIKNIESLVFYKRILIIIIGVILNVSIALFLNIFDNEKTNFLKEINLAIAFFNCLPILPLDGGRFFSNVLGYNLGFLKGYSIIKKISIILTYFIFFIGIVQLVLYPYNITLLCLSIYFIRVNKKEYINNVYKIISNKENYENDRVLRVKEILVEKNYKNKNIISILSLDYFLRINIHINKNLSISIDEKVFLNYIQQYGINGTIYDIAKEKIKIQN